jgi:hypothetical protein
VMEATCSSLTGSSLTGSSLTVDGSSLTVDGLSRASNVTLWLSQVRPRNLMYRGAGAGAGAGAG